MRKRRIKTRTKILISIFIYILLLTISYTIIFCIKGIYPVDIYIATIPPLITEFFILYKIKINEENKKNE